MKTGALPLPLSQPVPDTILPSSSQMVSSALLYAERRGEALHPTPLSESEKILGLNLLKGCAYRCGFCSARAYPGANGSVALYANTIPQMLKEIQLKRPVAVLICPSTDPFPPLLEVQEETARVVQALAEHGVESWLMTRGVIRPTVLQALVEHKQFVKVTLAIPTLREDLQAILEPGTATPSVRLEQLERLKQVGIPVQVALDPLTPNLTDRREDLAELLEALEGLGVREVTAGYMFLRQGIADNLREALGNSGKAELILDAFRGGPVLTAPGLAAARYLPKGRRQRSYAMLKALAARCGIEVRINRVTNPDFAPVKKTPATPERPGLLSLFLQGQDGS